MAYKSPLSKFISSYGGNRYEDDELVNQYDDGSIWSKLDEEDEDEYEPVRKSAIYSKFDKAYTSEKKKAEDKLKNKDPLESPRNQVNYYSQALKDIGEDVPKPSIMDKAKKIGGWALGKTFDVIGVLGTLTNAIAGGVKEATEKAEGIDGKSYKALENPDNVLYSVRDAYDILKEAVKSGGATLLAPLNSDFRKHQTDIGDALESLRNANTTGFKQVGDSAELVDKVPTSIAKLFGASDDTATNVGKFTTNLLTDALLSAKVDVQDIGKTLKYINRADEMKSIKNIGSALNRDEAVKALETLREGSITRDAIKKGFKGDELAEYVNYQKQMLNYSPEVDSLLKRTEKQLGGITDFEGLKLGGKVILSPEKLDKISNNTIAKTLANVSLGYTNPFGAAYAGLSGKGAKMLANDNILAKAFVGGKNQGAKKAMYNSYQEYLTDPHNKETLQDIYKSVQSMYDNKSISNVKKVMDNKVADNLPKYEKDFKSVGLNPNDITNIIEKNGQPIEKVVETEINRLNPKYMVEAKNNLKRDLNMVKKEISSLEPRGEKYEALKARERELEQQLFRDFDGEMVDSFEPSEQLNFNQLADTNGNIKPSTAEEVASDVSNDGIKGQITIDDLLENVKKQQEAESKYFSKPRQLDFLNGVKQEFTEDVGEQQDIFSMLKNKPDSRQITLEQGQKHEENILKKLSQDKLDKEFEVRTSRLNTATKSSELLSKELKRVGLDSVNYDNLFYHLGDDVVDSYVERINNITKQLSKVKTSNNNASKEFLKLKTELDDLLYEKGIAKLRPDYKKQHGMVTKEAEDFAVQYDPKREAKEYGQSLLKESEIQDKNLSEMSKQHETIVGKEYAGNTADDFDNVDKLLPTRETPKDKSFLGNTHQKFVNKYAPELERKLSTFKYEHKGEHQATFAQARVIVTKLNKMSKYYNKPLNISKAFDGIKSIDDFKNFTKKVNFDYKNLNTKLNGELDNMKVNGSDLVKNAGKVDRPKLTTEQQYKTLSEVLGVDEKDVKSVLESPTQIKPVEQISKIEPIKETPISKVIDKPVNTFKDDIGKQDSFLFKNGDVKKKYQVVNKIEDKLSSDDLVERQSIRETLNPTQIDKHYENIREISIDELFPVSDTMSSSAARDIKIAREEYRQVQEAIKLYQNDYNKLTDLKATESKMSNLFGDTEGLIKHFEATGVKANNPKFDTFVNIERTIERMDSLAGLPEEQAKVVNDVMKQFRNLGVEEGIVTEFGKYYSYVPHMLNPKLKDTPEIKKLSKQLGFDLSDPFNKNKMNRKLYGSIEHINKMMKNEYGIDNFFESNVLRLIGERQLYSNTVQARKNITDLYNNFEITVPQLELKEMGLQDLKSISEKIGAEPIYTELKEGIGEKKRLIDLNVKKKDYVNDPTKLGATVNSFEVDSKTGKKVVKQLPFSERNNAVMPDFAHKPAYISGIYEKLKEIQGGKDKRFVIVRRDIEESEEQIRRFKDSVLQKYAYDKDLEGLKNSTEAEELSKMAHSGLSADDVINNSEAITKNAKPNGLDELMVSGGYTKIPIDDTVEDVMKKLTKNNYVIMDRGVFEQYESSMKRLQGRNTSKFDKIYSKAMNFFKSWAVFSPGFHLNNAIGNEFNSAMQVGSKVFNPKTRFNAKKFLKELDGVNYNYTKLEGEMFGVKKSELGKQAIEGGMLSGFFDTDMTDVKGFVQGEANLKKNPLSRMARSVNPLDTNNNIALRASKKLGESIEANSKMSNFFAHLSEGRDMYEASDMTQAALFDYSDITDFEEGVLKKYVAPFYTFAAKNVPFQGERLANKPSAYYPLKKAYDYSEDLASDKEKMNRPDYVDGNFRVGEGKYLNIETPLHSLVKMTNPTEMYNMTNPITKAITDYAYNTKTYSGSQISKTNDPKEKLEYIMKSLVPLAATSERVYKGLNGNENDEEKLTRWLLGNRYRTYDLGEAEKQSMYDYVKELQSKYYDKVNKNPELLKLVEKAKEERKKEKYKK